MNIQRTKSIQRRMASRKISASEEIVDDMPVEEVVEEEVAVEVAPEATDLLFEAEDVAELVAEITGETVEVTVEDDSVTFAVGEDEYVVEPDGDEELLEACTRKTLANKKSVKASRKVAPKKAPVGRRFAKR